MGKKYQVFISSTYTDLKTEREKAINAILKLKHIPIGMELFNAGDDAQWAIIQRAIDDTDYYVLLIGFRYGTTTEDGISYTEKEYDYAVSKKIPIIAFIKDRKSPVTEGDRESQPKYQKKLDAFISKVKKREVNYWSNPDELAAQITSSLVHQIKLTPRTGWIRADFDPVTISQELAVLSKENRDLRKVVDHISSRHPDLKISILLPDASDVKDILTYKFRYPKGNIYVRHLNAEDDLIDEIKDIVTIEDLQTYNDNLPQQEAMDLYNQQNTLYENAKKNAHCFRIGITNQGNSKASNVFVDLRFPVGLLAYYSYKIEDMKKPKDLCLPENPVVRALNQVDRFELQMPGMSAISTLMNLESQWSRLGIPQNRMNDFSGINVKALQPGYYDRDHNINVDRDEVTIEVDGLLHSRTYTSDEIWFIATQPGRFTVDCEAICEEYETPSKFSFVIEVE